MRVAVLSIALLAIPAAAQEEEGDRRASFERASDQTRERVPGGTLLVVAYGVIWSLLLGYVGLQFRRTRRLEDQIDRLTRALKDAGKGGPGSADPAPHTAHGPP